MGVSGLVCGLTSGEGRFDDVRWTMRGLYIGLAWADKCPDGGETSKCVLTMNALYAIIQYILEKYPNAFPILRMILN